jgi:hypothetical protein
VPVVYAGPARSLAHLWSLVGRPLWQSPGWEGALRQVAERRGLDAERALAECDATGQAEGLYLKVEEAGRVVGRLKLVRPSFLQAIAQSTTHWLARPIVPNQLADDADLYDPTRTLLAPQRAGVPLAGGSPWSSD